jgi:pilus assembly protein FimV
LKPEIPQDAVEPAVTAGEEPALLAEETVVPSLPVQQEETLSPIKPEEIASLDFDLDLGTTSGPAIAAAAAAAEQAARATATEKTDGLDFDFDLGTPSVESLEAVAQQPPAVNSDEGKDAGLRFDLDLGSPVETVTDALDKDATDFARLASPENVVDLTTDLPVTPEREIAEGVGDLKLDFDLELDSEPTEATSKAVVAATEPFIEPQNLSADKPAGGDDVDFGFDLNDLQPEAVSGAEESGQATNEIDNSEAETKLELAHAYVEMGDLEGARELFNEVLNEGSNAQRAKAQAKLDQLDV